jgi:predicted transcriptional regulator of viral defense system
MKGLSKKEIELVANLEFDKRYFFTSDDVDRFAKDKTQRYNMIKNLLRKGRIVKLNRSKYYLIPIKAKNGSWGEFPELLTDEIMDGKDYFIGGWFAANYWRLTDQIPMQVDVYTTRRQGKARILNTRFVFHRTTKQKIKEAVVESIKDREFKILSKERSKEWLKSRE